MQSHKRSLQQSEYNRAYYAAHPELREKARERERQKRVQTVSAEKAALGISRSLEKTQMVSPYAGGLTVEIILLPVLVAVVSLLLLREMVPFYIDSEGSILFAWIKAVAMETSVILFSFLSDSNIFRRILYKSLAVAICLFSTYAMCSKHFSDGMTYYRTDQSVERGVVDLQTTIKGKEIQRDLLLAKGWITAARKLESKLDHLRTKLDDLRNQLSKSKPAIATVSTAMAQMIFRVLLIISNILAAHRLGKTFKCFQDFSERFETPKKNHEILKGHLKLPIPEVPYRFRKVNWFYYLSRPFKTFQVFD